MSFRKFLCFVQTKFHIEMLKLSKKLLLQNQVSDGLENGYEAPGTEALP